MYLERTPETYCISAPVWIATEKKMQQTVKTNKWLSRCRNLWQNTSCIHSYKPFLLYQREQKLWRLACESVINFPYVCYGPSTPLLPIAPAAWCITLRTHYDRQGFPDSLRGPWWVCFPAGLEGLDAAASKQHHVWGETRTPPLLYHCMYIRARVILFLPRTKTQRGEVGLCTRSQGQKWLLSLP